MNERVASREVARLILYAQATMRPGYEGAHHILRRSDHTLAPFSQIWS